MSKRDKAPSPGGAPASAKLVAAIFESVEKAEVAKLAVLDFDRDGILRLYGFSIVAREPDGVLTVVLAPDGGEAGDGVRALVSELSAFVTAEPTPSLGLVTDLGSWGDLTDFGVTMDFAQKIAAGLRPGKAALLIEIDEDWITPLDTRLEEIGGLILRTWRSDFEAEARL